MSEKLYDVLNKIQRWMPALAALYLGLTLIWPLPFGEEIQKTIALVATFLAATLEVWGAAWRQTHEIYTFSTKGDDQT